MICQRVPPNIKSLGHHAGIVGRAGGAYREAGATDTQSKQTVIGMRNDVCFGGMVKLLWYDIPRSSENPKILWIDDTEIVRDLITPGRPVRRHSLT